MSFSLRHQLVAISFSLAAAFLLLLRFCGLYSFPFFSTMLFLVLPTSFSFIFSKIKQYAVAGFIEKQKQELSFGLKLLLEDEEIAEEDKLESNKESSKLHTDEFVHNTEHTVLENDNCSASGENLEKLGSISPEKLDFSGSEDSISDDESLIEITLEDDQTPVIQQGIKGRFLPEYLQEFSPELLFKKHGLMELSEIDEEDNMIEIDITMGSIKCSRFEIKA